MAEERHYARYSDKYYIRNKCIELSPGQFEYARKLGYDGDNSFQIGCICQNRDHANQLLDEYGLKDIRFTQTNCKPAINILSQGDWERMLRTRDGICDPYDPASRHKGNIFVAIPVKAGRYWIKLFADISQMNPNAMPELRKGADVFHICVSKTTGKRNLKGPFVYIATYEKHGKTVAQCMTYSDEKGIKLYEFKPEELVMAATGNFFVKEMSNRFKNRDEKSKSHGEKWPERFAEIKKNS